MSDNYEMAKPQCIRVPFPNGGKCKCGSTEGCALCRKCVVCYWHDWHEDEHQKAMTNQRDTFEKEAFKIWLAAYTRNYGGTGLMESETLAEQAWYAAVNYMIQQLRTESEKGEG